MSQKNEFTTNNKIALMFVIVGLLCVMILSHNLCKEKLTVALTGPTAVIGAGLAQWTYSSKND